jgi:hypothetical protein
MLNPMSPICTPASHASFLFCKALPLHLGLPCEYPMQHNKSQLQAIQLELIVSLLIFMKPITTALLIISLLLSARATRASQEFDSQPQIPSPRSAQQASSPPGRSLASYPVRSMRGGSPPNPTESTWGGFSNHPARSLWGGFPLNPTTIGTTKSSLSASPSLTLSSSELSCKSVEDFCITQHRFSFQRPFSSIFNTAVDSSNIY